MVKLNRKTQRSRSIVTNINLLNYQLGNSMNNADEGKKGPQLYILSRSPKTILKHPHTILINRFFNVGGI